MEIQSAHGHEINKTAMNDDLFDIHVFYFSKNTKLFLSQNKELIFFIRSLEIALISNQKDKIKEICTSLLGKLSDIFGDKKNIPQQLLENLFPLMNTSLHIDGRLYMCLVLFSAFPNNHYYQHFKRTAEDGITLGLTTHAIQERIREIVQNNLSRWEADHWDKRNNPFSRRRRA